MPLFFFDALFLVLLLLLLHVVICYIFVFLKKVVLLHTSTHSTFTKRVACAYKDSSTGRCTIWPSVLHHFFTHTTHIMFMNSMFELSEECPLVCRSTFRSSYFVMFWTIPLLGWWTYVRLLPSLCGCLCRLYICEAKNDTRVRLFCICVFKHMSIGFSRSTILQCS